MVGLGCLFPFVLLIAGAAVGGVFGGTRGGLWGGLAGLALGLVFSLVALRLLQRARRIPE